MSNNTQPTFDLIATIPKAGDLATQAEAEQAAQELAELEARYPTSEGPRVLRKKVYRHRAAPQVIDLTIVQVITGATSFETAFIQEDYPYGRRLRCERASWVETVPRYGMRVVHRTTNPKRTGKRWNSPHPETYTDGIVVLFVATGENDDGKEYVYSYDLRGPSWATLEEVEEFERCFPELLRADEYARNRFESIKAAATERARKKAAGEPARLKVWKAEVVPGQGLTNYRERTIEV